MHIDIFFLLVPAIGPKQLSAATNKQGGGVEENKRRKPCNHETLIYTQLVQQIIILQWSSFLQQLVIIILSVKYDITNNVLSP